MYIIATAAIAASFTSMWMFSRHNGGMGWFTSCMWSLTAMFLTLNLIGKLGGFE